MRTRVDPLVNPWLICRVQDFQFALDRSAVVGIEHAEAAAVSQDPVLTVPGLAPRAEDGAPGRFVVITTPFGVIRLEVDQVLSPTTDVLAVQTRMPARVGSTAFSFLLRIGDDLYPILDLSKIVMEDTSPTQHSGAVSRENHSAGMLKSTRLLLIQLGELPDAVRPYMAGLLDSHVSEVLAESRLVSIPGSRPEVLGVRIWRDRAVAVLDLASLLMIEHQTSARRMCLILTHPLLEEPVGLLVPGRCRSVKLPLVHCASQRTLPVPADFFYSSIETDFATIGLFDPASLA